jgi:hypothetical protein
MSKPATNAAGEFHRCPKNPEAGDIRVKGFSFCPFCGDHISGFGEHNVVQMRPPEPSPPPPPPTPEPAKVATPTPEPAPAKPHVPTNEELEKRINDRFGTPPVTAVPPTAKVRKTPEPDTSRQTGHKKEKESSLVPLLIFVLLIAGGGYAAWNMFQNQQAQIGGDILPGDPVAGEAEPALDMTDTGGKRNPNITSVDTSLVRRPVEDGLVREIRYNYSNVRALPTLDSKILDQLDRGELIYPTGRLTDLRGAEHGEWYRVENPVGYVRFGNTRTPGGATSQAGTPSAPAAKPPVDIKWTPVESGLRVEAKITLRIRNTPSRKDDSNFTGDRIAQGKSFSPVGVTPDIGRDPGKEWYRVTDPVAGYVAKWETEPLEPAAPPTIRATAPATTGGTDSRATSPSTRALDGIRRRDAQAEPPAPAANPGATGRPVATPPTVIRRAIFTAQPTEADRRAAYPPRAQQRGNEATFNLECTVRPTGALRCDIESGQRVDPLFVDAAMALASKYRVAERDMDGFPTAGRTLILPMIFNLAN